MRDRWRLPQQAWPGGGEISLGRLGSSHVRRNDWKLSLDKEEEGSLEL